LNAKISTSIANRALAGFALPNLGPTRPSTIQIDLSFGQMAIKPSTGTVKPNCPDRLVFHALRRLLGIFVWLVTFCLPTICELSGTANPKAFVVTHSLVVDVGSFARNAFNSRSTSTSFDKKMW
jgi:hypothetical protein